MDKSGRKKVDASGQASKKEDFFHSGKRLRTARIMKSLRHVDLSEEFHCQEDTIKKWQQRGIPRTRIIAVAGFFQVPKEVFSNDFQISEAEFENLLRKRDSANIESPAPIEIMLAQSGLPYENEQFPWEEVISGARDEGTLHFYVGCKFKEEGNFDQAIFNLNKALATETLDGDLLYEAYYARGYSWFMKNELKKALGDYIQSLAPQFNNPLIPLAYDKTLKRPYKKPRFPWYDDNAPLKEIKDLDTIVEDIPARAALYYLCGVESLDANDYDSAIDEISKAIELDPQSVHTVDFLCAKGYACFQKEGYQDAVDNFSLVMDKNLKRGPEVLYFRALAYEKLDQLSNSVSYSPPPWIQCEKAWRGTE